MPGCERGKPLGLRPGAEHAELDLAVAHDVRVWREPAGIAVEQVGDDTLTILGHQVDHAELDPEPVADGARVHDVLLPRALADHVVLVDPVLHVRAHEFVALPLEQQGGDGAVDSAGHGDEDFFGGGHGGKRRGARSFVKRRRAAVLPHMGSSSGFAQDDGQKRDAAGAARTDYGVPGTTNFGSITRCRRSSNLPSGASKPGPASLQPGMKIGAMAGGVSSVSGDRLRICPRSWLR